MRYEGPMVGARFLARRKRFLCDVVCDDGRTLTAHVANTGAMTGCTEPYALVRLRDSENPQRKLRFSVEQIRVDGQWIVVNTARANQVVEESLRHGPLQGAFGPGLVRREARRGESRLDFAVGEPPHTWIEVKSVTLRRGERLVFPDAVTARGRKHVEELTSVVRAGERAVLLFLVPREGGERVGLAEDVDPAYARAVREALAAGVELQAWRALPDAAGVTFGERLPLDL